MKKHYTLVAGGAFLMLCAGPAAAGPCTQQISQLTSTLGARSPGSDNESAARAALDRARTLDVQGSEECKKSVREAKHLFGFDE